MNEDSILPEVDVEGFVFSHVHFTMADRYSDHLGWFTLVTLSIVSERPLPDGIKSKIDPEFASSVRKTYANLFEFAKNEFNSLTYAQYQKILYKYLKWLEMKTKEKIDNDAKNLGFEP